MSRLTPALSDLWWNEFVAEAAALLDRWHYQPAPMPTTCPCTDCGRNQPLMDCPECAGTGELK